MYLSPDGNNIAIGYSNYNNNTGLVRIYRYINSNWIQLGTNINGSIINENFGFSISLSYNGSIVAIGSPNNKKQWNTIRLC
ncbi:MAG: hypothetical protein ACKPKO_29550 [Candidatus Fonsibacter sp.]